MAKKTYIKIPTDAELRKRFPESDMASNILLSKEDSLWLPSSNIAINHLLGGGIPYGKILEIFGEESSGKSLLSGDFAKSTQILNGVVLWVDAEGSYDLTWAEKNGIDNNKVVLFTETAVETISDWIGDMAMYWRNKLTKNEPILLIVDSTAALDCLENIDSRQQDSKAEMGNRAKAIYKMLRIRNRMLVRLGICCIFINQLRAKVGATNYQDPDTTPGGNALKFYASQRLGIYRGKQIVGKINGFEERVGNNVSIRVKKNKVAPPRPTLRTEVYFVPEYREPGFHRYLGLPDILLKAGVITKKGSRFYYGETMIANGEEGILKTLESDMELRKKLIRKSGVNTISKTQRILASKTTNEYPIQGDSDDEEN